jgi:hypothetical protein
LPVPVFLVQHCWHWTNVSGLLTLTDKLAAQLLHQQPVTELLPTIRDNY